MTAPAADRPPSGVRVDPSELNFDVPAGALSKVSEAGRTDLEQHAGRCTQGDAGACQVVLDVLADQCAGGSGLACDVLWEISPERSRYELYGATCGGRVTQSFAGSCADP